MEQKVFHRPAVAGELARYVEARLHTDNGVNGPELAALQRKMVGSVAQPFYVTINPKTGVKLGQFEGATLADDSPFIEFLASSYRDRNRSGLEIIETAKKD